MHMEDRGCTTDSRSSQRKVSRMSPFKDPKDINMLVMKNKCTFTHEKSK